MTTEGLAMRASRALLILALATGFSVSGAPRADDQAQATTATPSAAHVIRVFYLKGMEPREAVTLLRSQVQIRQIAMIGDRPVIVVSDVAEQVGQAEALLREKGSVDRTNDPYGALDLARLADSS